VTATRFLVERKNISLPFARIEGREHRHFSIVLRGKPGQRVWLADEEGSSYWAEVVEVGRSETRLRILEQTPAEGGGVTIVLGQALLKSAKMDLVIQKATELGVDLLIPLITERSIVKLGDRGAVKVERWRRIVDEAAKQSRRSKRPEVLAPRPLAELFTGRTETTKLFLTEDKAKPLREVLLAGPEGAAGGAPAVLLVVGPEGGWSEGEKAGSVAAGFEPVSLGERPLRSETAALAALAMISHFWKA